MKDTSTHVNPDGSPVTIGAGYTESAVGSTPQRYYVFVSDREIPPAEWEFCCDTGDDSISTEYDDVGAADIGELTDVQFALFRDHFGRRYKGYYRVRFIPQAWLPASEGASLKVLIGNYKNLSTEQQKVLDIAVYTADNIRDTDGCGHNNITTETPEQPPNIADYPSMIQVPTGVGVPDTIESYQENIEDTDGRPANVNVVNQLTIDDLAEGFAKGLLKVDALSQKSREAKIRDMQEDMLSQQGHSPVDIARIHNPSAGKSKIRTESLRIVNTQRSKKNN